MDPPAFDPAWMAHAKLAFASFCGGVMRLFFRPASSFVKTIWLLFCCVTCGYYGTPAAMHWLEFDPEMSGAVGALLGFLGLSIAEGLLKAVEGIDLKSWVLQILSKRPIE